jgi:hypothetical protein
VAWQDVGASLRRILFAGDIMPLLEIMDLDVVSFVACEADFGGAIEVVEVERLGA